MIVCPNCKHEELEGALFCGECGTKLVMTDLPTTHNIESGQPDLSMFQPRPESSRPAAETGQAADLSLSLHLVESGMVLHLSGQKEYTLGRVADGQQILPDIDFSPYEAYSQGVSRLHAVLKVNNQRVSITDLGSSNGTRVNGQKIMPNVDFPLHHGDLVALGKYKVQVLIRK